MLRDVDGVEATYAFVVTVIVGDDGIRGERLYGSPALLDALMGAHYRALPVHSTTEESS